LVKVTRSYNSTTEQLVRPIQSKVTNCRDIHIKLVRYIVIYTGVCNHMPEWPRRRALDHSARMVNQDLRW